MWFLSQLDDAVIWLLRMRPLCIPRGRTLGRGLPTPEMENMKKIFNVFGDLLRERLSTSYEVNSSS